MAHGLARTLNVTPWQALLEEVKRTAGEVAWLDHKVGEAPDDEALESGGTHHMWMIERQKQRMWLGRVAKMALDAGVAERLVAQMEIEGQLIAKAIMSTLTDPALGLTESQLEAARGIMRRELLALEASAAGEVLEGHVVEEVHSE